jgi:DNA polymerase-1
MREWLFTMSDGPRLLLIDGSNLCFREFFSQKGLSYKGRSVDVLFGAFKSLISYHKEWPDHFRIFTWEGGYSRRLRESEAGVASGLIPETYKQRRREKSAERDPEIEPLFEQMSQLETLLDRTKTLQVRVPGYEADDVIYSYAKWAESRGGEAIIISSDKDFYQCISDKVTVYDARAKETWNRERFVKEFDFGPELWVDKGAIEGEVGDSKDNIFGVDGWGPVNACKYVHDYGNIDSILAFLRGKEKRGKREDVFIAQEERLRLAKSLKGMDIVPDLPRPRILRRTSEEDVKKMFLEFGFASLLKEAWRLV